MIRLFIDQNFQQTTNQDSPHTYDQFMNTTAGELIDKDSRRDIQRIILNDKAFYLKRIFTEKITSSIESLCLGKLPHSKPYKELLHIQALQTAGFATMEVVAAGELTRLGIAREGFILSKEIKGTDLSILFKQSNLNDRLILISQFAQLNARLHVKGFFSPVRLKDVFYVPSNQQQSRMVLIDREARNPTPKPFSPQRTHRVIDSIKTSIRRQKRSTSSIQYTHSEIRRALITYSQAIQHKWQISPKDLLSALRN